MTGTAALKQSPTPRQTEWLSATIDQRVKIAEQIGEEGGCGIAAAKGYEPILDGTMKTLRQGPDWVGRSRLTARFTCWSLKVALDNSCKRMVIRRAAPNGL